jgi:hypothetical protein
VEGEIMDIRVDRVKPENYGRTWIISLAALVDSLISLASFGRLTTNLTLSVCFWTVGRD